MQYEGILTNIDILVNIFMKILYSQLKQDSDIAIKKTSKQLQKIDPNLYLKLHKKKNN